MKEKEKKSGGFYLCPENFYFLWKETHFCICGSEGTNFVCLKKWKKKNKASMACIANQISGAYITNLSLYF